MNDITNPHQRESIPSPLLKRIKHGIKNPHPQLTQVDIGPISYFEKWNDVEFNDFLFRLFLDDRIDNEIRRSIEQTHDHEYTTHHELSE
jgi:hypothetical protein